MIRKHSALFIRYKDSETGEESALYYIAGRWHLGGYTSEFRGGFCWVDAPIKSIIDEAVSREGYSDLSVEKWVGLPINIIKSKLRLREWTSHQCVYGVPF